MRVQILGAVLAALTWLVPLGAETQPSQEALKTYRLVGAFWRADHTFNPQITLKNVVETSFISVTATLYSEDGTAYKLPPVELPPSGVKTIDIRSAIGASPAGVRLHFTDFGSADIEYRWHWNAAVVAQISNLDASRSLSYVSNFGLPPDADNATKGNRHVLEGLWWLYDSDVQPLLALTNTTGRPLTAELSFPRKREEARTEPHRLDVPPHATIRLPLRTFIGDFPSRRQAGTVRLEYNGPLNAIAADGELEDDHIGFSSVLPIRAVDASQALDPPMRHLITLGATGLMFGRPAAMMDFPASTVFSIYAVAANTGDETIRVTPRLYLGMSGGSNSLTLPVLELQPGEAKRIPVSEALARSGMSGMDAMPNLTLSYEGKESSLLATSGSIDATGTYVLESPLALEQETRSRTLCYWTLASGTDTMYNVWNYTESQQDVTLRLYYPGGTYEVPMSLAPGVEQMVDLKMLVMQGVADPNGHQLPVDVQEGSAKLEAPGGDNGRMRLIVVGATYNVQTATCVFRCVDCNGVSTYVIVPSPITLPIPVTETVTAQATWNTGNKYTESSYWRSTNTGVASVPLGPANGPVSSVAPGSAVISATQTLPVPGQVCSYNVPECLDESHEAQTPTSVTPTVTIQVQDGFLSTAGNGLVLLAGPGGLSTTAITAVGNPGGGTVAWTAGPNLTVNGVNSANASVSGTAASTSGGDTYISVSYTVNSESAPASVRFTVLNPSQLNASNYPGGANSTVPYSSGNNSGYITSITYYVYDQMSPPNPIQVPGIPLTELLSTISNPDGGEFTPPDNTPLTIHSNSAGQLPDLLYAYAPGGLPTGFSASRSQSLTANGFPFSPAQVQTYTSNYATISTQSLHR
jgi:hypothetical protein